MNNRHANIVTPAALVGEFEIQPFVPFVCSCRKIVGALLKRNGSLDYLRAGPGETYFRRHSIPFLFLLRISPFVVESCSRIEDDKIDNADADKCTVTPSVWNDVECCGFIKSVRQLTARSIVCTIDLGSNNAGGLHKHIVKGCIYGSISDTSCVTRTPSNLWNEQMSYVTYGYLHKRETHE